MNGQIVILIRVGQVLTVRNFTA